MGIKNSYFGLTMDKAEGKILQAVGKWVKKYSDRSTEKEKKRNEKYIHKNKIEGISVKRQ